MSVEDGNKSAGSMGSAEEDPEMKQKVLVVADMPNEFIDRALGSNEAEVICPESEN